MEGETENCPKCKKEWKEHFRIDSFNVINCCPECAILEWIHESFDNTREIWKRESHEEVKI